MSELHDHAGNHDHIYLGAGHARAEARTRSVVIFTAVFMVVEITAGWAFGSMALLADGVHMATHVGALGLAAWAYWMARRHAGNRRFSFGSGKFGDLAGFSSALVLGIIALGIGAESATRLITPVPIHYNEAIIIAAIGLLVNIVSAYMLADHDHGHDHGDHDHDHDHAAHEAQSGHQDLNMRAAYVHILADAATSVLAILALGAGALFGLGALDPLVGIVGALVIASWAIGLMRQAGRVLLDVEDDPDLSDAIRRTLESDLHVRIADLHLWRLGPGHRGLIVSLVSAGACSVDDIKTELRRRHKGLSHVTIEVSVCPDCAPAKR
jgi:cation diffusion facilitator family transporter